MHPEPAGPVPRTSGLRFRRILVPIDFSTGSARSLRYAVEMARSGGADLLLVHVAPREGSAAGARALGEAVRRFSESIVAGDVGIHVVVRFGSSEQIVRTARFLHADVIVLATRSLPHQYHHRLGN